MNAQTTRLMAVIGIIVALIACGPANNGGMSNGEPNNGAMNNGETTSEETNNGGANNKETNNGTADCENPAELDVSALADGGTIEAGSCYLVNSNLNVSGGVLTVEEGVVLEFGAGIATQISGDGRLTVQGTPDAPVVFTGQEQTNGFWKGIHIETAGTDNDIDYLTIAYAGSDGWSGAGYSTSSLYLTDSATGEVTNCEISHGGGHGFSMFGNTEVLLQGCTIMDNKYGGYVHPNAARFVAADNEFTDNATNVVRMTFEGNDTVEEDQTWNDIGVPWRIETRTHVGASLTIAPGATFELAEDASILVQGEGRLTAVGTETDPITFTGIEALRGYWKGIRIQTRGTDNQFDHVVLEYGGSDWWTGGGDTEAMVRLDNGSSLAVTNTTFRESGNYAIWAADEVDFASFSGNTFENNAKVARMHPNTVGQVAADNSFSGNDDNMFRVTLTNSDSVTEEQTWRALDIPYLITNRTFTQAALTIEPGTTIRFLENASLNATGEGTLTAVGTMNEPIVFTSQVGGETAGYWKGIRIESNSADNQLSYVEIRYAGSDSWYGGGEASGALYLVRDGRVELSNSTIADISGWGIDVRGNAAITECTNVTFMNVTEPIKGGATICN